jgi:hypothetical protein
MPNTKMPTNSGPTLTLDVGYRHVPCIFYQSNHRLCPSQKAFSPPFLSNISLIPPRMRSFYYQPKQNNHNRQLSAIKNQKMHKLLTMKYNTKLLSERNYLIVNTSVPLPAGIGRGPRVPQSCRYSTFT